MVLKQTGVVNEEVRIQINELVAKQFISNSGRENTHRENMHTHRYLETEARLCNKL